MTRINKYDVTFVERRLHRIALDRKDRNVLRCKSQRRENRWGKFPVVLHSFGRECHSMFARNAIVGNCQAAGAHARRDVDLRRASGRRTAQTSLRSQRNSFIVAVAVLMVVWVKRANQLALGARWACQKFSSRDTKLPAVNRCLVGSELILPVFVSTVSRWGNA